MFRIFCSVNKAKVCTFSLLTEPPKLSTQMAVLIHTPICSAKSTCCLTPLLTVDIIKILHFASLWGQKLINHFILISIFLTVRKTTYFCVYWSVKFPLVICLYPLPIFLLGGLSLAYWFWRVYTYKLCYTLTFSWVLIDYLLYILQIWAPKVMITLSLYF